MRGKCLPQLINEKYKGNGTRLGPGNYGLKERASKKNAQCGGLQEYETARQLSNGPHDRMYVQTHTRDSGWMKGNVTGK